MAQAMDSGKSEERASFGFREVDARDKARMVGEVFSSVAKRYDIMNDVMSMGLHRLWKSEFVAALTPRPGERFLDVAGGTGDIAFRIAERSGGGVTVLDINADMLAVGRERAHKKGVEDNFTWVTGDAEKLPIPDQSMDAYTIAFGIRNVTHLDKALSEAYRVLRPGGRFYCLEFSQVEMPGLHEIYDAYSFHLIPRFGGMIANDEASYRYLVESIRRFPDIRTFKHMIEETGFTHVKARAMSGGIVAIHSGRRI